MTSNKARRGRADYQETLARLQNQLRAQLLRGVARRHEVDNATVEDIAAEMGRLPSWLRGKLVGPLGLSMEDAVDIATAAGVELQIAVRQPFAPSVKGTEWPHPSVAGNGPLVLATET